MNIDLTGFTAAELRNMLPNRLQALNMLKADLEKSEADIAEIQAELERREQRDEFDKKFLYTA